MSTSDRCARATAVAMETILNECSGRQGKIEEVAEGSFVFIPEGMAEEEFGFETNSPETDDELEEAIESCMGSEWATEYADAFLGDDAPMDARETLKRNVCEGLFQ